MSKVTRVAGLLGISESEARKFCTEVQGYFKAVLPPCDVIADAIERHGKATPKEIAAFIDPDFHYTAKPTPTRLEPVGRTSNSGSNKAIVPKSTLGVRVQDIVYILERRIRAFMGLYGLLRAKDCSRCPELGQLGVRKVKSHRNAVSLRQAAKSHEQQLRYDTSLISAVANLITDNDRGNQTVAYQFLIDLERRQPKIKRLTAIQLLEAIRKACKRGPLDLDQAELEIRKMLYGYHSDPDHMQVISIPMGGKTD